MSVDGINAGAAAPSRSARINRQDRPFDRLTVGETLQLRVLERLGARDYLVAFGGERHRVESAITLEIGTDIRVGVVAVGERLVLRHLDADLRPDEAEGDDALGSLAKQYGVQLAPDTRQLLMDAAADAADPTQVLLSGLYLAKLGVAPERQAVAAVYEAQRDVAGEKSRQRQPATVDDAAIDSADVVLAWLDNAFRAGGAGAGGGDGPFGEAGRDGADDLARWALNLQDDGSLLYRYATLPLVIGGELRELQVALFTPRDPAPRDSNVRRLVMTFETPQLKQVRIEAKSVGERLAVAIDVAVPNGAEALAEREDEVRETLTRLGWSVEAVSYGINVPPDRAARRIVEHVLNAGTVDATF